MFKKCYLHIYLFVSKNILTFRFIPSYGLFSQMTSLVWKKRTLFYLTLRVTFKGGRNRDLNVNLLLLLLYFYHRLYHWHYRCLKGQEH
jgi:hypothetical protein